MSDDSRIPQPGLSGGLAAPPSAADLAATPAMADQETKAGEQAAETAVRKAREALAAARRLGDPDVRREALEELRQQTVGYVRRQPFAAAGMAFAAGFLIAVLRRP
jgi:ElaB/YqjD/DUF883 family membrane-anchored ribosome-binding protein